MPRRRRCGRRPPPWLALDHRRAQVEGAFQVNRAVLHREHHRLFRRQAEALVRRVEHDIAIGGLRQRPFPHVSRCQPGPLREFGSRRRAVLVQGIEQTQPVADANGGHAERASEIAEHLSNQSVQFITVDTTHDRSSCCRTRSGPMQRSMQVILVGGLVLLLICRPERLDYRSSPRSRITRRNPISACDMRGRIRQQTGIAPSLRLRSSSSGRRVTGSNALIAGASVAAPPVRRPAQPLRARAAQAAPAGDL